MGLHHNNIVTDEPHPLSVNKVTVCTWSHSNKNAIRFFFLLLFCIIILHREVMRALSFLKVCPVQSTINGFPCYSNTCFLSCYGWVIKMVAFKQHAEKGSVNCAKIETYTYFFFVGVCLFKNKLQKIWALDIYKALHV